MNNLTSDSPSDLAALNATVAEINGLAPGELFIHDDRLVAHLNAAHGYTIPPDHSLASKPYIIRKLHSEHAARHVQQVAQEHLEAR